ncbi:MAG: hypothetical protein AB1916_01990 [Thermodesulfobacteriota bacterium]
MKEAAYLALLLIPANKTALGLSAIGCFLAAALLGLFFMRGRRLSAALLFGVAQAGVYLALIRLTDGEWGFWLHEVCVPLLDLLGAPPAPLDGAHRTLYYGVPALLHGVLAGGLTLFLWSRLPGVTGGGSAPAGADPGGDKKGGKKLPRGKGRRK